MQSGLSAGDRKLLGVSAGVAAFLIVCSIAFVPSADEQEETFPVPSTYSYTSGGALAAYLLLSDLHFSVRRWEQPPSSLPEIGPDTILILAEPTETPERVDKKALTEYLHRGGRILFCGRSLKDFFPEVEIRPSGEFEWKEYSPSVPSHLSRDVRKIAMRPGAYLATEFASQVGLFGDAHAPVVVSWRKGAGELIWWAGATPLTNAGITRESNLQFLLNTLTSPSTGKPLTIYWDEFYHGQRGSLWTYFKGTPLAWGLLQLAIFSVILLFTFSRRSGPIASPYVVSRLSPLEFVDTMGGLYDRAGAASIPVDVAYRALRLELARRLGLPAASSDETLARHSDGYLGLRGAEVREALQAAGSAAAARKLPPREALKLVQRLERYRAQLQNPQLLPQEKI